MADTGENGAALPTISNFVSNATFSIFNFQMFVDRGVAFLVFWFTKSLYVSGTFFKLLLILYIYNPALKLSIPVIDNFIFARSKQNF